VVILTLLLTLQQGAYTPPDASPQRQRLVLRENGAFLIEESGSLNPFSIPQSPAAAVGGPRWQVDDLGTGWQGNHVAIGDSGAILLSGKEVEAESITAYSTSSPTPMFDFPVLDAAVIRPAVAQRNSSLVAMVTHDVGFFSYSSVVYRWDHQSGNSPLWSFTMPPTGNVAAGFCGVSEDGSRTVAVVENTNGTHHIRVIGPQGVVLFSYDIPTGSFLRHGFIDATGSRLFLGLFNGTCEIFDIDTGMLLHTQSMGGSFDSQAFSADGSTFAFGNLLGLFVVRETSPGVWSQIAHRPGSPVAYLAQAALNADGSRCGFAVQHFIPAFDRVQVGMWDVFNDSEMFLADLHAPGTTLQLVASDLSMDASGDYLAATNWGDSMQLTPEVTVYDAAGTLTASVDTSGSALSVAMDADGDVMAVGTKVDHANSLGNGGSILAVDAYEQDLHLTGFPQLGGTVQFSTSDSADGIAFIVGSVLGPSVTPFGVTEIKISSLLRRGTVFFPIPVGGLTLPLALPTAAASMDTSIHIQGVRTGGAAGLTNKVSVRLVP
jgi:hypothetical protein